MGSLKVIKPGLLTTIQDQGRQGLLFYAIPRCGAIDQQASSQANLILGNPASYPTLECTGLAPHLRFLTKTQIAISGAEMDWKINGKDIATNKTLNIEPSDILTGAAPKTGFRSYIAIKGLIEAHNFAGSFSTDTYLNAGGIAGRPITKNVTIEWKDEPLSDTNMELKSPALEDTLQIYAGPEYDFLTENAMAKLISQIYTIRTDSNRTGIRLQGKELSIRTNINLTESVPVLSGFIQLPPSGQPIILLNDCQSTGGYPRIAYLNKSSIYKLGQVPLNGKIKLNICDLNQRR